MADPALSIRGLTKVYGNGFHALKGIDLDVQQGDFFALLGPNGAGKSTTLGIVCSLVQKTAGQVSIFGLDIERDFAQAKYHLGVVPQEFNFNQFEKVLDIVLTQAGYYGMPRREALPRAETLLKDLDLWEKRNASARMLSEGMKRRLMIARALMHRPRLLILDEPTAGVDIELRRSMWEYMRRINREEGTTIILTTHYLEEAESLCRNVAIINRSEEHTSELQSRPHLVCRLLLEKKKKKPKQTQESNNVTNNDAPPVSSAHHTGYLRTRDAPSLPVDYIMRRTP